MMSSAIPKASDSLETTLVPSDYQYPAGWGVSYNPRRFRGGYEGRIVSRVISGLMDYGPFTNVVQMGGELTLRWGNEGYPLRITVYGGVVRIAVTIDRHVALLLQNAELARKPRRGSYPRSHLKIPGKPGSHPKVF